MANTHFLRACLASALTTSVVITTAGIASAQTTNENDFRSFVTSEFPQWELTAVGAQQAWTLSRGAGVTVAVLDSGVDTTHPEFAGRIVDGYDMTRDEPIVAGDHRDEVGHGTHVAGTIAAADDGKGTTGVAPQAKIMPVRVIGAAGGGNDVVVDGIRWAVAHGAKVLNLSLGADAQKFLTADGPVCDAVAEAVKAGAVVVAAAGNDGNKTNTLSTPAGCPGAISVASADEYLNTAYYSVFDSTIAVAAPGSRIVSTVPTNLWSEVSSPIGYGELTGTSMATPIVSGIAALLLSQDPSRTPAQIREIISSTAVDLGAPGVDPYSGAGLVNAAAALGAATTPTVSALNDSLRTVHGVEVKNASYAVTEGVYVRLENLKTVAVASYDVEVHNLLTGETRSTTIGGAEVRAIVEWSYADDQLLLVRVVAHTTAGETLPGNWTPVENYRWNHDNSSAHSEGPLDPIEDVTAKFTKAGFAVTVKVSRFPLVAEIEAAFDGVTLESATVALNANTTVYTFPLAANARARTAYVSVDVSVKEWSFGAIVEPEKKILLTGVDAGNMIIIKGDASGACSDDCKAKTVTVRTDAGKVVRSVVVGKDGTFFVLVPKRSFAGKKVVVRAFGESSVQVTLPGAKPKQSSKTATESAKKPATPDASSPVRVPRNGEIGIATGGDGFIAS